MRGDGFGEGCEQRRARWRGHGVQSDEEAGGGAALRDGGRVRGLGQRSQGRQMRLVRSRRVGRLAHETCERSRQGSLHDDPRPQPEQVRDASGPPLFGRHSIATTVGAGRHTGLHSCCVAFAHVLLYGGCVGLSAVHRQWAFRALQVREGRLHRVRRLSGQVGGRSPTVRAAPRTASALSAPPPAPAGPCTA